MISFRYDEIESDTVAKDNFFAKRGGTAYTICTHVTSLAMKSVNTTLYCKFTVSLCLVNELPVIHVCLHALTHLNRCAKRTECFGQFHWINLSCACVL